MKKLFPRFTSLATALIASIAGFNAQAYEGMAKPWQLNLQTPASPAMERLYNLHYGLLILIIAISVFVLIVMAFICIRFSRKHNPIPSKTTHNTLLEIIWTTIPILILVAIAIPSLQLHYYMQRPVDTELTVKVVGYQWYWHYDYPDGGFGFDSYIKKGNDLKPEDHRQLSVDNRLVVPVNTKVRVQITGADVIHSWAVPAFGVKKDAIPGRLNETWFEATQIGTFYGQCSQLCGVGHGFMPIVVEVVSKEDFAAWLAKKKQEAGGAAPADKNVPATVPAKAGLPLAKPESAKDKNPEPKLSEEKKRSKETGEGKPSTGTIAKPDAEKSEDAE